jgi:hypothetical protein
MPTVGWQTPQLCTCKVGHYEARRPSHAFGKDELDLDIRVEPNLAPLRRQRRERAACAGTTVLRCASSR